MINFISVFNAEGWSFIDRIDFNFIDAAFLVLVLLLMTSLFMRRTYNYALYLMLVIICWQLYGLRDSNAAKTKSELVVYQIPRSTAISVKNKLHTFLSLVDSNSFTMNVKPNLTSYNNAIITASSFNFCKTDNFSLLVLDQKGKVPGYFNQSVSHLLISNNAMPKQELLDKLRPKVIIGDGSNSYSLDRRLEKICGERGIHFYSTREKGAFVLPL